MASSADEDVPDETVLFMAEEGVEDRASKLDDADFSLQTPAPGGDSVQDDEEDLTIVENHESSAVKKAKLGPEDLDRVRLELIRGRERRHRDVLALALRRRSESKHEQSRVELVTSTRIQYYKEEYMFPKYVQKVTVSQQQQDEVVKVEKKVKTAAQSKRKKSKTSGEKTELSNDELKKDGVEESVEKYDNLDEFFAEGVGDNDHEEEDIKAFPTIKDVADYEAKRAEELWEKVETEENFDFTNCQQQPADFVTGEVLKKEVGEEENILDEELPLEKIKRKRGAGTASDDGPKSKSRRRVVQLRASDLNESKSSFTKTGSLRIRSERGDHRQHFPKVNPILERLKSDEMLPPVTLTDYLVMKSVATKRFMFDDESLSPHQKYALKQAYLEKAKEEEVEEKGEDGGGVQPVSNGPTARHIYGCMYCNFMGVKKNWLKHLRNKHRDVSGLMFCTYTRFCQMPFDRSDWLDKHIETVHQTHEQTGPKSTGVLEYERTDVKPDPGPDEGPDTFSPGKKSGLFYCMFCDYSHSKRNWIEHLKKKHSDKPLFYCTAAASTKKNKKSGTSKQQCNLIFESAEKRDSHVAVMHSEEDKADVKLEENLYRSKVDGPDLDGGGVHVCTYCGKRYRTRKGCREHEALRHAPQKLRHRCDHTDPPDKGGAKCDAAFYSAKELVVHKRKHTGELPFICGYCGNRYRSKATLVQHERQQHFDSEPNVECEICHKQMKKRNLKYHIKRHEGLNQIPCKFCGKTFSTVGARNRHEKIHLQEKAHACSFCGKAFVQKSNLQAHERIHTGERPFTCKHCGEGFMQHTRRNVHQLSCRAANNSITTAAGNDVVAATIVDAAAPADMASAEMAAASQSVAAAAGQMSLATQFELNSTPTLVTASTGSHQQLQQQQQIAQPQQHPLHYSLQFADSK